MLKVIILIFAGWIIAIIIFLTLYLRIDKRRSVALKKKFDIDIIYVESLIEKSEVNEGNCKYISEKLLELMSNKMKDYERFSEVKKKFNKKYEELLKT